VARQWTFWNNYLVGIPWEHWRALRREHRVDPGYRHRSALLTSLSFRNSYLRRVEERRHGEAVAKTRLEGPPLFVLGHWRSGTTFLHDLLACDPRWAAPNSIQTTFPFTFLTTEETVRRRFARSIPPTRPMDNVHISFDTPQEDEFGLCVACLKSPYLGCLSFPRASARYDPYLTLRDVPPEEVEEWKATFLWFLRKLTLRYRRPLLLKSPTHTARIRLLRELFPEARFVHIRRNPYAVFQSCRHLFRSLLPMNALQAPSADLDNQILHRYTEMHDALFAERDLIPEGRLHEVAYEELVEDPVGELGRAYERLGLDGFGAVEPRLREYAASVSGYRRNEFKELPPALRERIRREWGRSFEAWGYSNGAA
jgi:hypothetical protein